MQQSVNWKDVRGVLCSDLHLSHRCPSARKEVDGWKWYDVMAEYLGQLSDLSNKAKAPVFCAGDIFDKWNSPPELINFAIKHLHTMYAVPGQHDLPLHNYEDIKKSAYWTLVEAGKIIDLEPHKPMIVWSGSNVNAVVVGFPWGAKLTSFETCQLGRPKLPKLEGAKKLAIVHSYCWIDGNSYPGAPENKTAVAQMRQLEGFNTAAFGDNHKGFLTEVGLATAFNCGGFIRRKSDEIDYSPKVGLWMADGTVVPWQLDTSKDQFITLSDAKLPESMDPAFAQALVKMVATWKDVVLDFGDAVADAMTRYQSEIEDDPALKKAVQEVLDHVNTDKQGTGK